MNKLYGVYKYSQIGLLQSANPLTPLQNSLRHFGWIKHSKNQFVLSATLKHSQKCVTKRELGWLFAPPLRPGQKGYERQQKMHKRIAAVWACALVAGAYYALEIGVYTSVRPSEHFYDRQRKHAEEMKQWREAKNQEMLELAELRKKNAELYPMKTDNESLK